ncbi:sensor histidine kinase [Nitriliruptoraceae bacterium ZYF776]|nr:sensor histidine kinase [Profundirhabdus halotolerans]
MSPTVWGRGASRRRSPPPEGGPGQSPPPPGGGDHPPPGGGGVVGGPPAACQDGGSTVTGLLTTTGYPPSGGTRAVSSAHRAGSTRGDRRPARVDGRRATLVGDARRVGGSTPAATGRGPGEGRSGVETGTQAPRRPRALPRWRERVAYLVIGVGLERWARLVAVALVPLFLPNAGVRVAVIYGALATYVLLTALARRDRFVRSGDLLVSVALIAATQGEITPFLLFLFVAVAGPASSAGVLAGAGAGGMLAVVLLAVLGLDGQLGGLGLRGALPVVVLLPATGVAVAAAARLLDARAVRERRALQEANRLLSSLRRLADELPGGLDRTTIAAALLTEIRQLPAVRAAAVHLEDQGVFHAAASTAVHPGLLPALRLDVVRHLADGVHETTSLPVELQRACDGHPVWVSRRVGRDGSPSALLLVGAADRAAARDLGALLGPIADDGRIALDNARLFDGTLVRAADAARRGLAADLHDGVAQSLAHLRMELELRATRDGDDELDRLGRLAGTALEDLRATIAGLRTPLDGDLAGRLARHVADVRPAGGPDVEFETAGTAPIDPDRAEHLFRVAQEAISNALRHAEATAVTVALEVDTSTVELVVEDDGRGRTAATDRPGNGVGLRTMRERADRLSGTLTVRDRLGGGTVVTVRCTPTRPGTSPAGAPR